MEAGSIILIPALPQTGVLCSRSGAKDSAKIPEVCFTELH